MSHESTSGYWIVRVYNPDARLVASETQAFEHEADARLAAKRVAERVANAGWSFTVSCRYEPVWQGKHIIRRAVEG